MTILFKIALFSRGIFGFDQKYLNWGLKFDRFTALLKRGTKKYQFSTP